MKAKALIAAAIAAVSIAAVPTIQAVTAASPGVALACAGGGSGCE